MDLTVGGIPLPVYAYNALVCISAGMLALWTLSLVFRALGLRKERDMIRQGRVLVIEEASEHPEWLERAYVARLANRQAREIPSIGIDSLDVPVALLRIEGDAKDPFAAHASAEFLASGTGEYLFLFGVKRDAWTQLKGREQSFPASLESHKHSVLAGEWSKYAWSNAQDAVSVSSEDSQLIRGAHLPSVDDVSMILFLRSNGHVVAHSAASDGRLLETYLFHASGVVLSVRETFAEEDEDCLVCCAEPKNTILLPCRHCNCCTTCLARMDKCPVCRAPIESFVAFGNDENDDRTEQVHRVAARPEEPLVIPDDLLNDIELQPM